MKVFGSVLLGLASLAALAQNPVPNAGPFTASATGPRPDRKGGACFKWKAVE